MNKTFAEIFCSQYGLPPTRFVPALLRRTLYPQAAAFASVARLLCPEGLALDQELVRQVGLIKRREQLAELLGDFRLDSRNRGFWRSRLRLRISTRRMQREVYRLMGGPAAGDLPAGSSASPTPTAGRGGE